uniref:PiggyBac transposable element-derived protein domain-containing protein n=1 Tax=Astyanax mexicanus TaxID=7994 RepID=A0A3B1KE49_ASTMX
MARRMFTLAEVHDQLFRSDELEDESDDGSMAASMDSEDEDAFLRGLDCSYHHLHHLKSLRTPQLCNNHIQNADPAGRELSAAGSAQPHHHLQHWRDGLTSPRKTSSLVHCSFAPGGPRSSAGFSDRLQGDPYPVQQHQQICGTEKRAGIKRQWTDVNADEMLKFLSITIYMGLMKPSATRDLWRKDRLHSHPFPASVMAGYRYEAISAYLHMSDPDADVKNDQLRGQPEYDGLFRLKPLQEQILAACRAYYQPHQNLSIDERMVATKARIRMKQYMKDKPTKWGYKLFILADSCSGYTCDFSVYEGKARKPSGKWPELRRCCQSAPCALSGTGYTVYNWFGACGPSVRQDRLPKTTMRWIRDGPLLFVKWRDTRDVTMCSTVHKAYSGQSVQRRVRSKKWNLVHPTDLCAGTCESIQQVHGGVDLSDALIKYYSVTQKTRRWYVKLFLHFVDIAVVNSFIIHKEMALARQQKSLSQKSFREVLCMNWLMLESAEATTSRRKCVHCKMKTMFMCRSCSVPLCIIVDRMCFTEWHDQKSS